MKKLSKILFIFLTIFTLSKVKAETFYEDNYVTGVYATFENEKVSKPQLMRFIRRKSDNKFAYCLTPSDTLYENEYYEEHTLCPQCFLKISTIKYNRLSQIAYFGYNYKNHTDDKWYAITQFMLWKEVDTTANVYYTNGFKGEKITRFTSEEKEIETLISNFNTLPNIDDLNLTVNKNYELNDSNNVLNEYEIESDDNLNVQIENNKLVINPKYKGTFKIKFTRKLSDESPAIAYIAARGQDIFITGKLNAPTKEINVTVTGGDLTVTKVDSETLNTTPRYQSKLEGAEYELYKDSKLVTKLVIDDKSQAYIKDLEYGNYTLKEVKAPIGYNLDENIYNFTIDKDNTSITVKEDIIKAKLVINKYALSQTKIFKESNIKFSIYDINNNLIDTLSTDDNGSLEIELLYGKYIVKQETTWLGYKKVDDFIISITSEEEQQVNLVNNKIKANLKIIKKDIDTNKNIVLTNTSFKIKDLETNEYFIDEKGNDIFKTNSDGIIDISFEGGSYLLEEIESPIGYLKGDNIEFKIDENTKLINNTLEITVYNKQIRSKIKIYKQGKYINGNLTNLENVIFNIYALEDIITSDNTIYYHKNELVDSIITDKNGMAISKLLPIGKYYIKEIKTNDNFILDSNKYIINIDSEDIKELNLINNEVNKFNDLNNQTLKLINNSKNNLKTNYPKTSNKDIYFESIVCYLVFILFITLIIKFKHEK